MKEMKKIVMILSIMLMFALVAARPQFNSGAGQTYYLVEDTLYTHNLTANLSTFEQDITFTISSIILTPSNPLYSSISDFNWISLNSSTGILKINSTINNQTGIFNITMLVVNSSGWGDIAPFYFSVNATNDAPRFLNLQNYSWLQDDLISSFTINASDEEENYPLNFTVAFESCELAGWSLRKNDTWSNCTLFSYSNYSNFTLLLNISTGNDFVGNYTINFTVFDSFGANTTQKVKFTLNDSNDAPYFTSICSERSATEDSEFNCYINATDVDEIVSLNFSSNYSWFIFNHSSKSIVMNVTNFNASALVNFTGGDLQVGNWSINVTITDTGAPQRKNSSVFWFYIANVEDSVSLNEVNNTTLYENKIIYVNATDDDLLVPDKSVKNEIITFASNTSWVAISSYSSASNYTTAKITITYNDSLNNQNYTIRINATDSAGNYAERNFTIFIRGDIAPVWNETLPTVVLVDINESSEIFLNLSQNVTDADGDNITFSYTLNNNFSYFSLTSLGIINFTPRDYDVGEHIVTINASDGKLMASKQFNFTVRNINDNVTIELPLQATNATVNSTNSNMNTTEDSPVEISLFVEDDDFRILDEQKSFYNETLSINLTIIGANTTLFSFTKDTDFPSASFPNKTKYTATFTPRKADTGTYRISINITDLSNASSFIGFNLTVNSTSHEPYLISLQNKTSAVNRSLYYQLSANDTEDGASSNLGNFTFSYNITSPSGGVLFNSITFNSTGIINITFNDSQIGRYKVNITVNDSSGLKDSEEFWIYVYNLPQVVLPASGFSANLSENLTYNFTFAVNHSVQDNLTLKVYVNNTLRYNISYFGNNTSLLWGFTPNFTDESYGNKVNLTLVVYPSSTDLVNNTAVNTTSNFELNISHTNAPINFSGYIGDKSTTYGTTLTINLSQYFSDIDNLDSYYNQSINFTVSSNATPSYITLTRSGMTLSLSSLIAVTELITIHSYDLNDSNSVQTNASSNYFSVEFTEPSTVQVASGGGGGATRIVHNSIKILAPGDLVITDDNTIQIPFSVLNTGQTDLNGINLSSKIFFNNLASDGVSMSISNNQISILKINESKQFTLTIKANTKESGKYKAVIYADVDEPQFTDWAEFYIDLRKVDEFEARENIVFTEKLVSENPVCLELMENVNNAKKYAEQGNYQKALEESKIAVEACNLALTKNQQVRTNKNYAGNLYYVSFATLGIFAFGFIVYIYKRVRFKRYKREEYI